MAVPCFKAMPEIEYVVQTGSNMKEIHLEADDKHVFTPQLCVHSLSDTQGLFSGTKVYVYAFVCVYILQAKITERLFYTLLTYILK